MRGTGSSGASADAATGAESSSASAGLTVGGSGTSEVEMACAAAANTPLAALPAPSVRGAARAPCGRRNGFDMRRGCFCRILTAREPAGGAGRCAVESFCPPAPPPTLAASAARGRTRRGAAAAAATDGRAPPARALTAAISPNSPLPRHARAPSRARCAPGASPSPPSPSPPTRLSPSRSRRVPPQRAKTSFRDSSECGTEAFRKIRGVQRSLLRVRLRARAIRRLNSAAFAHARRVLYGMPSAILALPRFFSRKDHTNLKKRAM